MGYPDVQDGQARHVRAGTGAPGGSGPDEIPDTEQPDYGFPAAPGPVPGSRGGHRAADASAPGPGTRSGTPRPGTRTGAHRAPPSDWPGPPRSAGPGSDARPGGPGAPGAGPGDRALPSRAPGPDTRDRGGASAAPAPGAHGRAGTHRTPAAAPGGGALPPRAPGFGTADRGGAARAPGFGADERPGTSRPPGASSGGRSGLSEAPGDAFGGRRTSGAASSRGGGRGLRGPIRGYPPLPGQADPVYPPGQFSSWNRASTRAAWLGAERPGGASGEPEAEPGYSALAVSDPSADATATQTWAVIDDAMRSDRWTPRRADRDWGSHTGDTGPVLRQTADGRPAGPGRPAAPRGRSAAAPARPGAPGREAGADRRGSRAAQPAGPGRGQRGLAPPGSAPTGAAQLGSAQLGAAQQAPRSLGTGPQEPAQLGAASREPALPESGLPRATDRPRSALGTRQAPTGPGQTDVIRRSRTTPGDRAAPPGRRAGKSGRSAGRAKSGKRHKIMMTGLLLAPVLVVVLVVAGYVHISSKPAPAAPSAGHAAAPQHSASALPSPSPTLGPWKHIESRSQDPTPLNVTELFPQQFTNSGSAGVRTVDKTSTNCPRDVFGSKLAAAVRKADCTQALRASYLSTDRKIMSTVGVLNLVDATAAEHAGRLSGATEFIKQLPAAHGPTKNLSKGTGIVEAEFKGHYLILIWTEFANLKAPSGKSQRKQLEAFSADLIAGTVNVSLTKRMVNGRP